MNWNTNQKVDKNIFGWLLFQAQMPIYINLNWVVMFYLVFEVATLSSWF